ncbi:FxSxx-COOH system tetratricopeptide repeat protein [Kibdelosporangium philippinense]|uniref:FxSxx-COOH system tetratricopeptide repeat protein n=1 Tax=Kibdelosporangium philippinense TaxID=211113 RepID=A0ABS8ZRJ2_9PSEU|nr:FxSxx-COOH system tetratricopeptide repeat protein [Kibdelosporangium philippinense]MCE7010222.1 FxSxx-COOH system tetratricopeptide repeat protein [Kibdelosporangium philippinense]
MWRTLVSAVAALLVLFLGSLAFNAASGQSRWPGPLDFVRTNPWVVLLLLIPLALLGFWQAPRRERKAKELPAPATYRLPPRNPNFTGRDAALRELRQRLTSTNDVSTQVVHGLGGVGKTQLAVEYAYRYRQKYRFVAFVDAEEPDLVAPQFTALARELGLTEVSAEQAIPQVYGKLLDRRPWLIIFDNGEKPSTLTHALPTGDLVSNGHIIVTTRVSGWSSRAGVIDLDVFTRRESVDLLVRRVPGMTDAVADRIAEQLGDLPLGLEQAAGYMDYNQTAPEDYLALLTSRLEEMIGHGELADRPSVVVSTLWQLSVRTLAAELPDAVRLLELCALLAPEPIPLNLFDGSSTSGPDPLSLVDGSTPLDVADGPAARGSSGALPASSGLVAGFADPVAWDRTVGALAGLGLAKRTDAPLPPARLPTRQRTRPPFGSSKSYLLLHRLVQAAVRAGMSPETHAETRAILSIILLSAVPHDIHGDPDAGARWQELLPHVLAVTKGEPPAGAERAANTAVLLRLASEFVLRIGDRAMALPLGERALAIDESLAGRDAERGFDLIVLAQIYRDLGEFEKARPLAERALRLHEESLPANSPAIATDLATLARILHLAGDYAAALPFAERALEIDEAAYGPDDPYVSFDLVALANVHLARDDYATAVPLIDRALRIREGKYAPDHLYIGYVLLLKARAVHALNDPAAAELARRGARILHGQLGKTHPKTEEAFRLAEDLGRARA